MQSSSEQPLVGEERYVTTRITAAKETIVALVCVEFQPLLLWFYFIWGPCGSSLF